MSVHLRSATIDDVAAIGAMHRRSAVAGYAHVFPPSAPPPTEESFVRRWRASIADDATVSATVAESAGEVVGVVMFGRDPGEPATGHIARLYVDPEHWGCGIGLALHAHAVGRLRHDGCVDATLWILDGNDRAGTWYRRLGWRPTGVRRPVRDVEGIDELQLRISLTDRAGRGTRTRAQP